MFGRQLKPAEVRPLVRRCDQSLVFFRPVPPVALCMSVWMLLSAPSLKSDEPEDERSSRSAKDRLTRPASPSTSVPRSSAARRSNVWRARPSIPERSLLKFSPPVRQVRRTSQAALEPNGTTKSAGVQTAAWKGRRTSSDSLDVKGADSDSKGTQVVYRQSQPPNQLNLDQPQLPAEEREPPKPPEPQTLPPAENERPLPLVEQDVVAQEAADERIPEQEFPRKTPNLVPERPVDVESPPFAKQSEPRQQLRAEDLQQNSTGLLNALKNTVDARTLASPQVLVTHGQEARIQIGGKIEYRQSTTTETSTVQGVEFLDVGVVLTVTPYIGMNGQVLMKVNPEVSDGLINFETELPDEQITTVDSSVLLNDGQGMVIGGLIREIDDDQRIKAAGLGEVWMVGRLFQQSRTKRSRKEAIVVLVPRIVDCPCPLDAEQQTQLDRTEPPLFHGALEREFRPWEPVLPEVRYRPRDTRRNLQEFRRSEGSHWVPEPPRSTDFYLNAPTAEVPVIMEPVAPYEELIMEPPAETPAAGRGRSRAERIPVEAGQQPNSVQPVSGTRPGFSSTADDNNSHKSRQNLPVPENQAFHGQVKKSELTKSGQQIRQKISARNGSFSKGYVR